MNYLTTDTYRQLVAALAALKPDATSDGLENQIKITLGEIGDVWPVSICNDGHSPAGPQAEAPSL